MKLTSGSVHDPASKPPLVADNVVGGTAAANERATSLIGIPRAVQCCLGFVTPNRFGGWPLTGFRLLASQIGVYPLGIVSPKKPNAD